MMTAAFIGNLTGAVIFLVVVFFVVGFLGSLEKIMALVGKQYRPTFVLIAAGLVVIGIAIWVL